MTVRRIFAALALLCAFMTPALAQKTKATLNAEIGVQFPDNASFQITPLNLRTVTGDIVNSIMPTAPVVGGNLVCFNGTTGLLQDCAISPGGVGLTVGVSTIAAGTTTAPLFNNAGVLGNGLVSSTWSTFLQIGTGAVSRTVQSKFREYISLVDYGADPTGVVDSEPAILRAINAVPAGSTLYVPPGNYLVNSCQNNAVFDFSGANGNKQISVAGQGWQINITGGPVPSAGSVFKMGPSIPSGCSFMRFAGTQGVYGRTLSDFAVVPSTSAFDFGVGNCGLLWDGTGNDSYFENQVIVNHVFIGNMGTGSSICATAGNTSVGVLYDSTFMHNQVMHASIVNAADANRFIRNTFGQNVSGPAPPGLEASFVSGVAGTQIRQNVFSNVNGNVVLHSGTQTVVDGNEGEQGGGTTNTLGTMFSFLGGTNVTFTGNSVSGTSAVGNYPGVTVGAVDGFSSFGNWINTVNGGAPHYVIGAGAVNTTIGDFNCYTAGVRGSCVVSNSSASTVSLTRQSGTLTSGHGVVAGSGGAIADAGAAPVLTGTAAGGDLAGTYPNPTLGSVIAAGGPTGSATVAPIITYDAKGRLTAVSSATITPAVGSITGLGTGVGAALAINIGSAGAFTTFNGAHGTPSSITLTNGTGLPISGITGLGTGVGAALAINIGTAGSFVTNGGALGTPSSGVGTNITGVNAATLGGATFATPGAIGGGTPSTGAFTTVTGTTGTFGTNSVTGSLIANGPNTGTGAGSSFASNIAGTINVAMGNYSKLVTGGAFDATPVIYMQGAGIFNIGGSDIFSLNPLTPSTSSTTGSFVIKGTSGLGVGGALWTGTYAATTPTTVSVSGTSCSIKGARWFVTDNNTAAAFGAVITSGGALQTPIYCDGTVWRQGANDNIPAYLIRKFA